MNQSNPTAGLREMWLRLVDDHWHGHVDEGMVSWALADHRPDLAPQSRQDRWEDLTRAVEFQRCVNDGDISPSEVELELAHPDALCEAA